MRILRYSIYSGNPLSSFNKIKDTLITIIIVRCVEKEAKPVNLGERLQVNLTKGLKFILYWVDTCPVNFPRKFMQSLKSIVQNPEDKLQKAAIEIIRKLSINNTAECAKSGCLKTMIDSILNPTSNEMAEPVLLTLLFLLNEPKTRCYIRPYIEIESLMAPLTNVYLSDKDPKNITIALQSKKAMCINK